jgi:predicted adenylyl cyclase CyaB
MRNLEIKTRPRDWTRVEVGLATLGAEPQGELVQHDLFYRVDDGRLKLRLTPDGCGELIHYHRTDTARIRRSEYTLVPVQEGVKLAALLDAALERCGEVHKTRILYRVDNVRVHLDTVRGLGRFLEVEAVVDARHSERACRAAAARVLAGCGITPREHLAAAYVDMRPRRRPSR